LAELGVDMFVWFNNYVGLNVGLMFDFLAPEMALNGDFQLGLAMRF
jgi:hypothetical protein